MKEQEHVQQGSPGSGKGNARKEEPITSDSIKNAHAAGDGAMERSLDSIPDEEELHPEDKSRRRRTDQY